MTEKSGCCPMCKVVDVLVIIGALNWGLVGFFQFDLVARLLGEMSTASRVVYGLVGLAAIAKIISCLKLCPCNKKQESCCGTGK